MTSYNNHHKRLAMPSQGNTEVPRLFADRLQEGRPPCRPGPCWPGRFHSIRMAYLLLAVLATVIAHSGCASRPADSFVQWPSIPGDPYAAPAESALPLEGVVDVDQIPAAETQDAARSEPDQPVQGVGDDVYVLQPGDIIDLQVFREPELSGSFSLTSEGVIRHPLLGVVALSGLTVSAAEAHVRHRLATEYLVNPRVILRAESIPGMQVLMMGEVRRPGPLSIPYGGRLTLLEAIAQTGGFTDMASPNRVRVVRTVDGKNVSLRVRVGDVLAGRGKDRDILLEPNDLVTIPEVRF